MGAWPLAGPPDYTCFGRVSMQAHPPGLAGRGFVTGQGKPSGRRTPAVMSSASIFFISRSRTTSSRRRLQLYRLRVGPIEWLVQRLLLLSIIAVASPAVAAPAEGASLAICRRLEGRDPPAADQPTAAQRRELKGCDSEALYYGEAGPPDFTRARLCAFADDEGRGTSATEDVFSGATILMQLYANGLGGLRRDLDQATAYACVIDGAPAEVEGRVAHLQALKTKPEAKRFDYCDDITSGLASGFCAARDADIAKRGRAARTAGIEARIAAAAKPALTRLRKAAAMFVAARGNEVDQSGTARAQMEIDEEEATRDAFTAHLAQIVDGRWSQASIAQAKAADAALNAAYGKALAFLTSKDNVSTVKPDDVRKAERAWISYRDAFVTFAQAASPRTESHAVAALLTQERVKALQDLTS